MYTLNIKFNFQSKIMEKIKKFYERNKSEILIGVSVGVIIFGTYKFIIPYLTKTENISDGSKSSKTA